MKQIRTIKYIDMFVPADSDVDHLIDITKEPYYKKVSDISVNTFNICEIIFKKSLDYGFSVDKAIIFSKKAGYEHLENNSNADTIINDVINQLVKEHKTQSPKYNINNIPSTDNKEFKIIKDNDQQIIINDYCNTGIEILKHLVGIESKMIIYELNIIQQSISVSFLDMKDTQFKITDFNLSSENIKFIIENLKTKDEIITVKEISENIQVFFLGKMIYDTKEGKRSNDDIMKHLSTTDEDTETEESITPYEDVVKHEYNDEDTVESNDEDTVESNDSNDNEEKEELLGLVHEKEEFIEYNNKILINPIILKRGKKNTNYNIIKFDNNDSDTNDIINEKLSLEHKKEQETIEYNSNKILINPIILKRSIKNTDYNIIKYDNDSEVNEILDENNEILDENNNNYLEIKEDNKKIIINSILLRRITPV